MTVHGSSEGGDGGVRGSVDPDAEFADVLKTAIARRGLTLARAQARVAEFGDTVSVATLSQWQSGRSLPGRRISRSLLTSLDRVLDLPVGTLRAALDATRERRRAAEEQPLLPEDLYYRGNDIQAVFDSFGVPFQDGFTRVSVVERLWLTAGGLRDRQQSTMTLRAEKDGLFRFGVCQLDPDGHAPLPTFRPTFGCTLHEEILDRERNLSFAEFRLFEPLGRGELATVGFEATFPAGAAPVSAFGRAHRTAFRDAALEVIFHEDKLPLRVEQFYEPAESSRITSQRIFCIADTYGQRPLVGRVAQSYFSHRGPGVSGLRWRWADDDGGVDAPAL